MAEMQPGSAGEGIAPAWHPGILSAGDAAFRRTALCSNAVAEDGTLRRAAPCSNAVAGAGFSLP
jgi:hypothetical protein